MKSPITKKSGHSYGIFYTSKDHRASCEKRTILSPKHYRYRGIALAWTAIVISTLFLIVGLSIDVAKLLYNLHQLQNATDAAALAGATIVKVWPPDDTRQFTHDVGYANKAEKLEVTLRLGIDQEQPEPFFGDENSYDILLGRWVRYNRTFIPTLDAPNAVRAYARRNAALGATEPALRALNLIFGPLAGVDTADAATLAVAWCNDSGGAGLIVLSPLPNQGLEIGATADINIDGGGIHVNSTAIGQNNKDGAWLHGTPLIDAGFLNVVGGITPPPDSSGWESIFEYAASQDEPGGFPVQDYEDYVQHIDDPLAAAMLEAGEYYVESTGEYAGMRLRLPELIQGATPEVPTWQAYWNDVSSGYDLWNPTNPSVYMRWNDSSSSYEQIAIDPTVDYSNDFHDTIGLGTTEVMVTDPITGEPVLDPITGEPTYTTTITNPAVDVELPPGYYPYGMRIQNGDDITLVQGAASGSQTFFIFGGGEGGTDVGIYMSGGSLTGNGVTCFVTQNFDTGVPGVLRVTGGSLDLDSPGDWTNQNSSTIDMSLVEGLNGIAVWQDPAMPDLPDAHLNGNGDFSISGTIYCPDPIHMRLEGDLGDTGNQILCGTASILGTAEIRVNYDGRNHGQSSRRSILVK